jgi:hypothetical protein
MSVARSSMRAAWPESWTPESAWTALRVEAARVTVCSCANSASRGRDLHALPRFTSR